LSSDTRGRWADAIVRGADYLITSGDTTWYANGNINLAYAEVLYLAWRVSGQQRFADAYEAEWAFLNNPPKPRWNGYGLALTKLPTAPDGSNGAGYLTESSTGPPGFDPEYTQLQLDTASSLFVLSHDARVLRLMNLLLDVELPRVSSTFTLDATGGSRHSLYTPFMTSGLAVLVHYGRNDLASLLPVQADRITSEYATYMVYTHSNYYFGLSRWLTPLMLDADGVAVVTPPGAPTVSLGSTGAPAVSLGSLATTTNVPSSGVRASSTPQLAKRWRSSAVGDRRHHRHRCSHRVHHRRRRKGHAARGPRLWRT
jgi:hypothetical protein